MKSYIQGYIDYRDKIGDRRNLYKLLVDTYPIKSALYPGSHIDISPSLVIPRVIYVDSFKGTAKFFEHLNDIEAYIEANKEYPEVTDISFYGMDYTCNFSIDQVDLIISQFAGFVGQATKKYLKPGGVLLSNDSHGDATMAYLDDDFELIGVMDSELRLTTSDLSQYFKFAKSRPIDQDKVLDQMKGPKYQLMPANYVFMKKY